jgi:hypothetical protein
VCYDFSESSQAENERVDLRKNRNSGSVQYRNYLEDMPTKPEPRRCISPYQENQVHNFVQEPPQLLGRRTSQPTKIDADTEAIYLAPRPASGRKKRKKKDNTVLPPHLRRARRILEGANLVTPAPVTDLGDIIFPGLKNK